MSVSLRPVSLCVHTVRHGDKSHTVTIKEQCHLGDDVGVLVVEDDAKEGNDVRVVQLR